MLRKRLKGVFGVGINDADYPVHRFSYKLNEKGNKILDKRLWTCPYYEKWYDMLRRCYSGRQPIATPAYEGVTVCPEWLRFSTFKGWMEAGDWEGKELDKDLLGDGTVYSPTTCCWLPGSLNQFFKERSRFTGVAVGVSPKCGKYQARVMNPFTCRREYLGLFSTPQAAHEAWRARKCELAGMWADVLEDDGYESHLVTALRTKYAE